MESTGLARFLFELASDERLGILEASEEKPLRHAQNARRLKITDSETTRHVNRLASTGLLTKNPQSQYEPTSLARLVSAGFPFFRFLLANREFLLKHDVREVPAEFVERLGALNGGTFVTGMYDVAAAQERYLRAVKQRIWVLTDQLFERPCRSCGRRRRPARMSASSDPAKGFDARRPDFHRSSATTPCAWFPRLESFLRSSTTWRACASRPSKERLTWSRCSSCPTRRDIDGLRICLRSYGVRLGNGLVRRRLFDRQESFAGRLPFQVWPVRRLCVGATFVSSMWSIESDRPWGVDASTASTVGAYRYVFTRVVTYRS